jgi:hypothetical protein|tara:strand:+ start:396 stop:1304 length:909 start_codon:yes stop_codon:yes gene_type:complete
MLTYDRVAVGNTLSSVLYCFYTQTPLIFAEKAKIHPFEFFDINMDFGLLKMEPKSYQLNGIGEQQFVFGVSKQQTHNKLLSLLSLSGLVPFSDLAKSINVQKDNLVVTTTGNRKFKIEYNELIVFDDKKVSGLPPLISQNKEQKVQVLDWFEINIGSSTTIDYLGTNDDFVKDIFFYSSQRPATQSDKKDLLSISYLTHDEAVHDYQYSDTYARFKIIKCMKEAGIKGLRNGKNPNYPERSPEPYKWLSPKISLMKREILPLPMGKYKNTKKIKFNIDTPEQIVLNCNLKAEGYLYKLLNAL